ncbi:MAG: class I SAM-dependent methyltransferase [Proteobacteria bacterium]|nr:class I SAM-dependent methyltransferase [Pseudomonadota bacterium]
MQDQPPIGQAVLEFYKVLPFNYRHSVAEHAQQIRARDAIAAYSVLPPLLRDPAARVLEIGCGTGWLTNAIAYHYRRPALGIDFNPVAVERARAVSRALEVESQFLVADLFQWAPDAPYPLVVSLGVLHHTADCVGAVRRLCVDFVAPGGHLLVGLYHQPGRRPFLDHFQAMEAAGASEDEMRDRFGELDSRIAEETHLASWFRDQVLHPHETQHTLREMVPVIEDCGMTLVSTSINRFQPFQSLEALYREEQGYAEIAAERLAAGQYFPGFFVFLAAKRA